MSTDLTVQIGTLKLQNPVMVASGTFGYGEEFNEDHYPIKQLGAVVTKGISEEPWQGNPMPRLVETPSGMINAIGLQNVGLEVFVKEKLPYLKKAGAVVIVNIIGKTIDEYVRVAERLDQEKTVGAIELNISCPNVKAGGVQFGIEPAAAAKVTEAVRKRIKKPLIVKLSPNVTDICQIGQAVEGEGADAISAINTITAMAVDVLTRKPILANVIGGLSGPAIKPIALRMVWQLAQKIKIPIIGIGGITNLNDILEYLLVGADAVQIGTTNFVEPLAAPRLIQELKDYCEKNDITSLSDIRGGLIM